LLLNQTFVAIDPVSHPPVPLLEKAAVSDEDSFVKLCLRGCGENAFLPIAVG